MNQYLLCNVVAKRLSLEVQETIYQQESFRSLLSTAKVFAMAANGINFGKVA